MRIDSSGVLLVGQTSQVQVEIQTVGFQAGQDGFNSCSELLLNL